MNTDHRQALQAMRQTLAASRRLVPALPRQRPATAREALDRIKPAPRPKVRPVGFVRPKQAADGGVVLAGRRAS